MPVSYTNGAIKVRDKDGNYVQMRGGSDSDWEKIRLALEELGYLKEDVQALKEYILAGGGTGGGGVVDVDDASNTRKGITYLTDDPNANKNAATGVTAVTPKALQAAIDDLKEQIISGEITPPEPEPEPEPELVVAMSLELNWLSVYDEYTYGFTCRARFSADQKVDLGEYKGTINWQLVKVEAGASERLLYESSYEFRSATGLLSWHVPIAFFSKGDQVKIKATATLSALENKPSASAETVVPANFLKYNNIGKPNEIGFGVGLAPNTTCEKIGLIPLPGTEDPESFQYGLYEATAPDDSDDTTIQTYHAYFKYIPRFYYRALSKDGVLLNEEELKELELFTGLTVAQMQEAQRRGGTSAIVLAPDNIFEGFDPEEFGFHLPSAFTESVTTTSYFSSKASGFFISNTLSSFFESTDSDGKKERQFYCGLPSFKFAPTFKYGNGRKQGIVRGDDATPLKEFDLPSSIDCVFGLGHKFTFGETHATCMTFHMWAAIRMLAYAAGLYCKDNTECAWYAEGYNACPCGINEDGAFDSRRPDVQTSPSITETTGTVWVDDEKLYPLTTHNGRINGITNCNGWMQQPVLGICAFHKQILNFTHLTSLSSFEQSYTSMVPEGLLPPPADFTYYTAVWGSSANECNSPFVNYDSTEQADWGRYDFFLPVKSSVASNPESQFGSSSAFVYRYSSPSSSNNTLAVGGYPHALPGHTAGLFCNMPAYGSKVSEDSDVVISPYISFRLGFFV